MPNQDVGPGGLCSGDLPIVLFPDSPKHAYYSGIIPRNCPFKPSFLELNIPHIVPKCATSCTHPTECLEQNQRIIWDHLNPHFWGRRKRGAYYSGIFYSADPPYYSKSSASIIRTSLHFLISLYRSRAGANAWSFGAGWPGLPGKVYRPSMAGLSRHAIAPRHACATAAAAALRRAMP